MTTNICWGKSEFKIKFKGYLGKEKNESGDTILIVKIHKGGSVLESR